MFLLWVCVLIFRYVSWTRRPNFSDREKFTTHPRGRSPLRKKERNRKKWIIWHCRRPNSLTYPLFFFFFIPAAKKKSTSPFSGVVSVFLFLVRIRVGREFWVCQMDPWTFWVTQNQPTCQRLSWFRLFSSPLKSHSAELGKFKFPAPN